LSPDRQDFSPPAWIEQLVAELLAEGELPDGAAELVPDEIVQQIMMVAVKLYMAKLEAGEKPAPFVGQVVSGADVASTVEQMLEAVSLEWFELGMWQALGKV
jgi:hypothetical protein